jgi:hypothetical protein
MMFLVRSAFWLGIVYSAMPMGGEAMRAADQAQSAVAASAVATARQKCMADLVACRALVSAAGGALTGAGGERSASARDSAPRAKGASAPSTDTLSASDLATPWRGRPPKSGA